MASEEDTSLSRALILLVSQRQEIEELKDAIARDDSAKQSGSISARTATTTELAPPGRESSKYINKLKKELEFYKSQSLAAKSTSFVSLNEKITKLADKQKKDKMTIKQLTTQLQQLSNITAQREETEKYKREMELLKTGLNEVIRENQTLKEDVNKFDILEAQLTATNSVSLQTAEKEIQQLRQTVTELSMYLGDASTGEVTEVKVIMVATRLKTMMDVEEPVNQECGLNALYNMVNDKTRDYVKKTNGLMDRVDRLTRSEYEYVKSAALRTLAKIENAQRLGKHGRGLDIACEYFGLCNRFLDTLLIPDGYFDPLFNCCYCDSCISARRDPMYVMQGHPPKDYGLPIGWCRFALKVETGKAEHHSIWDNWHVAFHGTKSDKILNILQVGHLVKAGDVVIGGERVSNRYASTSRMYLSPSIRYSGLDEYSTPVTFTDPRSGTTYKAQTALHVRIRPDSYSVEPKTLGPDTQIDPRYPNTQLHWVTEEVGSHVVYGLLVKVR